MRRKEGKTLLDTSLSANLWRTTLHFPKQLWRDKWAYIASSLSLTIERPLNVIDIPFALIDYEEDCTIKLITHREVFPLVYLLHSMNCALQIGILRPSGISSFANSQDKVRRAKSRKQTRRTKKVAIRERKKERRKSQKANRPNYETLSKIAILPNFSFLPNTCKPNWKKERNEGGWWRVR